MAVDINKDNEESVESGGSSGVTPRLFGRLDIYTTAEKITRDNVIEEVTSALAYHFDNVLAEEYLYWYRRGFQPVLNRKKDRNSFILNKVVTNHYEEVVTFKNGYLFMLPAFYSSRKADKKDDVDKLNEYLYRSGKQQADNILADWFHTVGKAALYVEPNNDEDVPLKAYAVDPRSAFVVYSLRPGNRPVFGVNIVISGNTSYIDVFTDEKIFHLTGTASPSAKVTPFKTYNVAPVGLTLEERNRLGHIPIIEYRYNSVNMAAPESVLPLLDAISDIESNRCDGVAQFIQSIAVAVNCQFEEGTTADDIKKAGFVALSSIGDNKADFRLLTSELNQDQTQTLVDDLYETALRICSMPSTTKGGRSTSDTQGAVIFRDGWEQAASAARNTEDLFKESNRLFDEILVDVLRRKGLLNIKLVDFDLIFVRNETANVQSKAQAAQTMLAMGMAPQLAFEKSGLSNDPVSDVKMSEKYLKLIWGDPEAAVTAEEAGNGQGEAVVVEEDNNNGENTVGGV